MFVLEVTGALARRKVRFALVGGYALAMHGIVRATMDVDIVIHLTKSSLADAEGAMKDLGLTSRIPVSAADISNFRQEYIEKRNLVAWSFADFKNPSRQVDLLIVLDVDDVDVEKISFRGKALPVASLQSLLKMKLISNRAEDQLDIKNLRSKIADQNPDNK